MEDITSLAAVVLALSFPIALVWAWAWQRGRKFRSEERIAALARGVAVSLEADLAHPAASRRAGILFVAGAIGYVLTFWVLSRWEPDAMEASVLGLIPFAIGVGFFIDAFLIRRETRTAGH